MSDDISEAFRNIRVEDFLRDTSAVQTDSILKDGVGLTNFHSFTNRHVNQCADHVRLGDFTAYSVLHSPTEERLFHPDDDETAHHFANRLKREAGDMSATWMFVAMVTPGRAYNDSEADLLEPIDPDNKEQINQLIAEGILQVGVCWFSEFHEGGDAHTRGGMIMLDDADNQVEGDVEPEHNPFHEVLEG